MTEYGEQLSAARFRAERDQARQEYDRLRARLRDSVPRDAYESRRTKWLRHIRECETALHRRREHIKKLENTALERRTVREEDHEAAEWVREHGGLDSVKKLLDWVVGHCSTKQQLDFDFWLSGRVMHELGFDEDMADRDEVERRFLARLMPEGMEWLLDVWPKWSNGEYCKFGDWWTADKYGDYEPKQLRRLVFYTPEQLREWEQDEGDNFGYEWDFMRPANTTYRPDKVEPPTPKVYDADGVEICVGDTVYGFSGQQYEVTSLCEHEPSIVHAKTVGDGVADDELLALSWQLNRVQLDASKLTHRAPVLAADGKPLRERETVYHVADGRACVVREVREGGAVVEPLDGRPRGRCRADYLTHERPDSFEQMEKDANDLAYDIGFYLGDYSPSNFKEPGDTIQDRIRDLVCRAKKLAESGER